MKKSIIVILGIFQFIYFSKLFSQSVSINTSGNVADTSAILDISSSLKGVLVPRMKQEQRAAIFAPAEGLLVYQVDETKGFYFYTVDSGWTILAAAKASWLNTGNEGTNAAANFIGTRDNNSLSIRTNSVERLYIDGLSGGNIGIGTNIPASTLDINGSVSHTVITAPGSITLTSYNYTVILTGTSGAIVTLPPATGSTGRIYVLVNRTAAKNTSPDYQTFTVGLTSPLIGKQQYYFAVRRY